MPAPSVSVIVPAFNAEATLPACLAALERMSYPAAEIIVFSDGSTDRTEEIAEASGARVIKNGSAARGPGHGRNVAARAASSQLLLFVDADVIIGSDCLEILVREMQEQGAAAAFGSYDSRPGSTRLAGLYVNLRHHFVHQHSAREASTFWTGVGLIERTVFLEHGGYDEGKFTSPSIEDVEFGMRLKAAGHRIRLVPEAQAKHCKDWTLWRTWHTDVVRRALPWSRLLVEGRSEGADLNLSSSERVKALASVATFASLLASLFVPWALFAALVFLAIYVFLNRQFIAVLAENLTTSQWLRATLLHLCYHSYSLGAFLWVAAGYALRTAFGAPQGARSELAVRFDRPFFLCLVILTMLFSWALILHGKPAYFDDTASYLSGGEKIFDKVFELFGAPDAPGPVGSGEAGLQEGPGAIRSLPYYVLTFALSAPGRSLSLLALFQAAIAAFYVIIHCRVEKLGTLPIIGIGAALAALTPLSLVAAFTVPDIFAVPIIGGIVLLATRFDRLTPAVRIVLVLVAGLGVSAHVSYPPLALAMTGLVLLWLAWTNRSEIHAAFPGALLAGLPFVLGVVATMTGGLVGFGEASVAPKRLPLVLARSMSDGPGRWYLQETCPIRHYAVCEIWPDGNFPDRLGPILFQQGGIMRVATEEQLDRMREEEPEIVLNAIRAYPFFQAQKSLTSIAQQFVTFHPIEINFDRRLYYDAEGNLWTSRAPRDPSWAMTLIDRLAYVAIPISALMLLFTLPSIPRAKLPVLLLCILGIAANMAICAMFSAVAARYAMRVLWMVPLLAALYSWAPARAAIGRLTGSGSEPGNGRAAAIDDGCKGGEQR